MAPPVFGTQDHDFLKFGAFTLLLCHAQNWEPHKDQSAWGLKSASLGSHAIVSSQATQLPIGAHALMLSRTTASAPPAPSLRFQRSASMSHLHPFFPEILNIFSISLELNKRWVKPMRCGFCSTTSLRQGYAKSALICLDGGAVQEWKAHCVQFKVTINGSCAFLLTHRTWP